jgi:hypothetical protein
MFLNYFVAFYHDSVVGVELSLGRVAVLCCQPHDGTTYSKGQ